MSTRRRSRRRRSSTLKGKHSPKLFDYFVVIGLQQTDFNAPTDKIHAPNSKDLGWTPTVQYSYNANKIVSASTTTTTTSTTLSSSPSQTQIPKLQTRYSKLHTTAASEKEELELMEQIRKFSFCDLSDLVNRYNALSDKDKEARKYYKILSFKHGLQSEKFTFCVTKSNGKRLYGHCRRLFTPDVNLKPSEMPSALVLISSHGFHQLFDQIMDYVVARWFICHQAIFPILDALLLNPPPALGDTFRVTIPSQVSKDDEVLTFKLNSTYHVSLKKLFQTLSVDNILWLISCVLTERRLIFYCNSLETLSECIHGLLALIYPFRWQHIFVPVLPESLINYLAAPMPFIIGIKSYLAHSKTEFEISEVVLVDLDKQSVRSTDELQHKLKALPSDPSWKLKRELKKNLKKYSLFLQTYDDYRHKYGNYSGNKINIPRFATNIHEAAKGWDDLAFYDAFLAFFVLLIGDWKNFYDESNKNVPKPPYHLSSEYDNNQQQTNGDNPGNESSQGSLQQSTTATSHTPPLEDSVGDDAEYSRTQRSGKTSDAVSTPTSSDTISKFKNLKKVKKVGGIAFGKVKKVGGIASEKLKKKLKDEAKRREVTKDKKMYYNAEALAYIELLCQSQLFQTWFVRQQKEADDSLKKLSGIQDRYDYVMQNFNRIGASYTGCYKYLCQDSKYRSANHQVHGNAKQIIELCASFTSNRDYTALMQQQQSIQLTLRKLSMELNQPMSYEYIKNIILCRLNDCFGKNNHPHGLMALYLLANLIETSSDRILIECINNFVFYANVLTKYQHEKMLVAKQMNKIALEVVKLSTRLEELKKKKIDKYVAFGDDYEYKYDEEKYSKESGDDNKSSKNGKNKSAFIDDKIAQIDFANIANNKQDQTLLGNFLHSNTYDAASSLFTEVSQFSADNVQNYRKRCLRGEVRMIPPFEHLRNEFAKEMPDDLLNKDDDDIFTFFSEDEMDEEELKQNQDKMSNGQQSKRSSETAQFAMDILNSFSPVASKPNDNDDAQSPKMNTQQLSIFDLGHQVTDTKVRSMSNFYDDEEEPSQSQHSPSAAGFLTRTDTKRDGNGNTIRDFNKDWVNFDDNGGDDGDDPFASSFFNDSNNAKKGKPNALDSILFGMAETAANNNNKPRISKRIKGGIGTVFGKAKETVNKGVNKVRSRRNSNNDTFGIDDVSPIQQESQSQPHVLSPSKDFDALNFGNSPQQKRSANNNGYNKLKNRAGAGNNNMHKADPNPSKAASLFDGFDFTETPTTTMGNNNTSNSNITDRNQFTPSQTAQDTFGDLFGAFTPSNTSNSGDNNMDFLGSSAISSIPEKKSVRDVMQNAYNNKSYNQKNKVQAKNPNLFDDLFQ